MKKTIATLLACLILCTGMVTFAACKTEEPSESSKNRVTVSTFGEVKELRNFVYSTTFGKAELNKDLNYVSDGETSGKFTVASGSGTASIKIFCDTVWNNKCDYTDVKALSVDVFNPNTEEKIVRISFTTRKSYTTRSTYIEKTYALKPGKNFLIYEFDRGIASNICYMDKVEYISFEFDKASEPYVIYMDNLEAHLTDESVSERSKVNGTNEEGEELFFFDDITDLFGCKINLNMAVELESPELSICRDKRYIRSGTGSLKCENATYPEGNSDHYPGFLISGTNVSSVDFTQYSKIILYVMADKDLNNGEYVEFYLFDENGARSKSHSLGKFKKGEWRKMEIDIADLENGRFVIEKANQLSFHCSYSRDANFSFSFYFDDFTLVK